MHYLSGRLEAGKLLADQIEARYHHTNCAIIALNDGGVMVGAQIALRLKAVLTLLLTTPIELPRENDVLATVNQEGNVTYNNAYSPGELEEMQGEYRTYIDQQQEEGLYEMSTVVNAGGVIREDLVRNHNIILVSDGLNSTFSLDSAADFLRPIKTGTLIVATPLATIPAVDRMHVLADEIYCLNPISDYINTDHYYSKQDVPDHATIVKFVEDVISHWK